MKLSLFSKLMVLTASLMGTWAAREPLLAMWRWFGDREAVTASMDHLGFWGPFVLAVLFILQVFLAFIPGQALMIACGYVYGFWGGFLLSWLSLVVGGEIAFYLARRHGRPFAEKWISPDVLTRWDKNAQGQGITFYAISLVMPLVPNDAMCYVAGLDRITHRRFSTANLLGRGLACLITSWIGAFGSLAPTYVWIIILVLGLLAVLTWQLARRLQNRYYLVMDAVHWILGAIP
jgi:uncharacterized membrane protein YdjX (TVP38/TMEM64 family)